MPHVTAARPLSTAPSSWPDRCRSQGAVLKGIHRKRNSDQRHSEAASKRDRSMDCTELRADLRASFSVRGWRRRRYDPEQHREGDQPDGRTDPFGPRPSYYRFRVVGIFETGFYDLDLSWAFTSLNRRRWCWAWATWSTRSSRSSKTNLRVDVDKESCSRLELLRVRQHRRL